MAHNACKKQNEYLLSLFMELPARTDLIDTIDNDPLMNTQSITNSISDIDNFCINSTQTSNQINEWDNTKLEKSCSQKENFVNAQKSNINVAIEGVNDDNRPLSNYINNHSSSNSLRNCKKINLKSVINSPKTNNKSIETSNKKVANKQIKRRKISRKIKPKKESVPIKSVDTIEIDIKPKIKLEKNEKYFPPIEKMRLRPKRDAYFLSSAPIKEEPIFQHSTESETPDNSINMFDLLPMKSENDPEIKNEDDDSLPFYENDHISNTESDSEIQDRDEDIKHQLNKNTDSEKSTKEESISHAVNNDEITIINEDDQYVDKFFDEVVPEKKKKNLKKYTCNICNLLTSCKGAYKAHLLRKHNLIYVYGCVMCEMKFESVELLMAHRKNDHYDKKINGYMCTKCDRTFKEFHKLVIHMKELHKLEVCKDVEYCVDKNKKYVGSEPTEKSRDGTGTIVFKTPKAKVNEKESKKNTQIKKPYKTSVCHLCGKIFNFLGQFKEHLLKHYNIKNYVCEICQKAFISKRILTIHKKIHDSISDRKFICGFVFDNVNDKNETSDDQQNKNQKDDHIIKSDSCEEQFQNQAYQTLNGNGTENIMDAYTVTGAQNNYKENSDIIENKNFAYKPIEVSNSSIDKRISNSKTPKPNVDARITHNGAYIIMDELGRRICNFACVSKSDLNKHRLVHLNLKPFTCPICDMSFRQTAHLRRHIKRHTGKKEYKCDICKTEFVTKDNLNNHLRTHNNVLPFICEVCGKTFFHKTQYLKHVRNYHPIQSKQYCENYNGVPVDGQCTTGIPSESTLNFHKTDLISITGSLSECNNLSTPLNVNSQSESYKLNTKTDLIHTESSISTDINHSAILSTNLLFVAQNNS